MFIFLLFVWIILNGKFTVEILVFGLIISAALFAFIVKFLDYSLKTELQIILGLPFSLAYIAVLFCEIIKAGVIAMKLLLNPNIEPEPAIVHFKVDFKYDVSRVLLANSITLTPGTVTVSIKDNTFSVHCLDKDMGIGIESSIFVKLLLKYESVTSKISKNREKAVTVNTAGNGEQASAGKTEE